MLLASKEFQRSSGDMFYILGNEAKSFHSLVVVLHIIIRLGPSFGELLGKLDSFTDFEVF